MEAVVVTINFIEFAINFENSFQIAVNSVGFEQINIDFKVFIVIIHHLISYF